MITQRKIVLVMTWKEVFIAIEKNYIGSNSKLYVDSDTMFVIYIYL